MKKVCKLFSLLILLTIFMACNNDDDSTDLIAVASSTATNIPAPQTGGTGQGDESGAFTKFSFATGTVTDSDTEWDIAFRGLSIAINGGTAIGVTDEPVRNGNAGAAMVKGTFGEVTDAADLAFVQDSENGFAIPRVNGEGWYNYDFSTFTVTPVPGRILVFRTHDGKFAKVEVLSYYRDAPSEITPQIAASDFRFYTFNYVYNPNEGETDLTAP
ncbi:MAG: HmuY family protein [Bacteroidota bacterium]